MGRETLEEPMLTSDVFLEAAAPFRHRTRFASLRAAARGLVMLWRDEPNLRLQVWIALVVMAAGVVMGLSVVEWRWVSLAIGLVLTTEMMNCVIERTINFIVGAQAHPTARWIKDASAGCVLAASILAMAIGILTFGSHL